MGTRPTDPIVIRASNAVWDASAPAPLIGQPNKTPVPPGAKTANGWNVDEKPGAQGFNFYENRNDQWALWVTEGQFIATENAHIVETDSTGKTAVAAAEAGGVITSAIIPLAISPNDDTGAVSITAPGLTTAGVGADLGLLRIATIADGPVCMKIVADTTVEAMRITQAGLGVGLAITAADGLTAVSDGAAGLSCETGAPDGANVGGLAGRFLGQQNVGDVVKIEQTNVAATGNCLVIEGSNAAICLLATQSGGKNPAAKLQSGDSGGGDRAAPMVMVPQTFDVAGQGAIDGSFWLRKGTENGAQQHHPRFYGESLRWMPWTVGPTCTIERFIDGNAIGGEDLVYFEVLTATFPNSQIPLSTGSVIINFKCRIRRDSSADDINAKDVVNFQFRDVTNGDAIIETITRDLPTADILNIENTLDMAIDFQFVYVLPAIGVRQFSVDARLTQRVSGKLIVIDRYFSVRPLPATTGA